VPEEEVAVVAGAVVWVEVVVAVDERDPQTLTTTRTLNLNPLGNCSLEV